MPRCSVQYVHNDLPLGFPCRGGCVRYISNDHTAHCPRTPSLDSRLVGELSKAHHSGHTVSSFATNLLSSAEGFCLRGRHWPFPLLLEHQVVQMHSTDFRALIGHYYPVKCSSRLACFRWPSIPSLMVDNTSPWPRPLSLSRVIYSGYPSCLDFACPSGPCFTIPPPALPRRDNPLTTYRQQFRLLMFFPTFVLSCFSLFYFYFRRSSASEDRSFVCTYLPGSTARTLRASLCGHRPLRPRVRILIHNHLPGVAIGHPPAGALVPPATGPL